MVTDKAVLITGGTGALGQPVVQAVLERGYAATVLYVVSSEWDALQQAVTDGARERLLGIQGDALSPDVFDAAVRSTTDRFGHLDGLFHLMGGYAYASLEDTTPDLWRRMIDLNLTSAYVAARAVRPALDRGGVMLFVGAQAALQTPANQSAYNAAKAGVIALARTLAAELRPDGIRVNAVVPDIIDTPANRRNMPNAQHDRWLMPQQVAESLLFLLSDAGSGVTGATVTLQRS